MTFAAIAALTAPGGNAAARQVRAAAPTEATAPRQAGEPIMAIVSIKSQQVIFYDAEGWITRAPVSTGTTGRETPAGVFAVVEKDKDHHSTMYDDASMPNMQRITWNGIALHGGPLPGYAASHGCVRMPYGFAEKLFDKTRIGMRIIISPNDAAPVDFTHPALFVPNAEAIAAAPARAEPLVREATEAARIAEEAKKVAAKATGKAASLKAALSKLEWLKKSADAELPRAEKFLATVKTIQARAEEAKQKVAAKVADLTTKLDAAKADATSAADEANAAKEAAKAAETAEIKDAAKIAEARKAAATAATKAQSLAASLRQLEMLKKSAEAELAYAEKGLAAATAEQARAEDAKQKAAAKVAEIATKLDTAKADAKAAADDIAATKEAAKAAEAKKVATARAALDAKLALEPFSIYISRETQKLYVRRNTHKPAPDGGGEVFDSFEVPVTIRNPEKRLGTHIFTAMAKTDTGLRWSVVSIDGEDPKDALDRITIPQEVIDRIGPTALPRSSIVISDEPLSAETNYRTEFVVVLKDHPQGGFITRKPTPRDDLRIASRTQDDGGFFGSLFGPPRRDTEFQRSWDPQPVDPRLDPRRRDSRQDPRAQQQQPAWWGVQDDRYQRRW